ncbi:hypothetical protein AX17_006648 [Amanita inopinata Kibby_2008]|nr:hypothetical protein AX17_006648 [Amanita inopinata Kibby_2008]
MGSAIHLNRSGIRFPTMHLTWMRLHLDPAFLSVSLCVCKIYKPRMNTSDPGVELAQAADSFKLHARSYTQMAFLLFLVLETADTLRDEIKYIWRAPWTTLRVLYLISRYFTLAYQIAAFVIVHNYLTRLPIKSRICRAWFHSQMLVSLILFCLLETVLNLRVYALHHKNRKITGLLIVTYIGVICAGVFCNFHTYVSDSFELDEACFPRVGPRHVPIFSIIMAIHQSLLWGLTYAKQRAANRLGWADNPILKVVTRDGVCVYIGILSLSFGLVPYSLSVRGASHIAKCVAISFFSVATCRLIMNTQRLKSGERDNSAELTTISVGFMGSSPSV